MQTSTLDAAKTRKPLRPVESKPTINAPSMPSAAIRTSSATIQSCPVEHLAVTAAATLRALYAIGDYDPLDHPGSCKRPDMVKTLRTAKVGPRQDEVRRLLFQRLDACANAATFHRATSVKGAIFQAMLTATDACGIDGQLINAAALSLPDRRTIEDLERRVAFRSHSLLSALATAWPDDDLKLLRTWFFRIEDDPLTAAEWAIAEATTPL